MKYKDVFIWSIALFPTPCITPSFLKPSTYSSSPGSPVLYYTHLSNRDDETRTKDISSDVLFFIFSFLYILFFYFLHHHRILPILNQDFLSLEVCAWERACVNECLCVCTSELVVVACSRYLKESRSRNRYRGGYIYIYKYMYVFSSSFSFYSFRWSASVLVPPSSSLVVVRIHFSVIYLVLIWLLISFLWWRPTHSYFRVWGEGELHGNESMIRINKNERKKRKINWNKNERNNGFFFSEIPFGIF